MASKVVASQAMPSVQGRPNASSASSSASSAYSLSCSRCRNVTFLSQRPIARFMSNPTNVQAAVAWGGAAGCAALWITQPFDYIKSVLTSKPDADE